MTAIEKFRTTKPPKDAPVSITRRRFLVATGLSLGAAATTTSCIASPIKAREPVRGARDDWSSVRDQFNLSHDYIHLATFALASHPRPVREAIENYRRALDENPFLVLEHGLWGTDAENLPRKVREAAAHYVEGQLEEIALTGSTTMGLALVYHGLPIKAGQEVLTTAHDFYPHHESIRLAAERAGALMRKIALFDSFDAISEDAIVNRIRSAVRPNTRAVGITWVHSASGLKLPVRHIAEAIKEAECGPGRIGSYSVDCRWGAWFWRRRRKCRRNGVRFLCLWNAQVDLRPPRHRDYLGTRGDLGDAPTHCPEFYRQ